MTEIIKPSIGNLFTSFFRLGLTAFGGPSMVTYIRKLAVENKKWLDNDTFSTGVALCQIVPGATSMQTAAYVGLKARGIKGSAAAFIGFVLPAFLLMTILAVIYKSVINYPFTAFIFSCLHAIIVAIIASSAISFGKLTLKDWKSVLITIVAFLLFGLKVNPILIIVFSAGLGILLSLNNCQTEPVKTINHNLKINLYTRQIILIALVYALLLLSLFFLNKNLFQLSTLMFRIDLFAFGGGFASLPLMYHEVVDIRHLLDSRTFLNGIALGQVTPGPIVITATFIGYMLSGLIGAAVGTVSIFLPSFLMVAGITPVFDKLRTKKFFNEIIRGVLSSFVGLLLTVTIQFGLEVRWGAAQLFLAIAALTALLLKTDILYVVVAGVVMSALLFFI